MRRRRKKRWWWERKRERGKARRTRSLGTRDPDTPGTTPPAAVFAGLPCGDARGVRWCRDYPQFPAATKGKAGSKRGRWRLYSGMERVMVEWRERTG